MFNPYIKFIPGNVVTTILFEYFEFTCLQFSKLRVSKFNKILTNIPAD